MKLQFKRRPTKVELHHIVTKIWCVCIDFQSLRDFDDVDSFYNDTIDVIKSEMTLADFMSNYGDTCDDILFDTVYDTLNYLTKKGIIK